MLLAGVRAYENRFSLYLKASWMLGAYHISTLPSRISYIKTKHTFVNAGYTYTCDNVKIVIQII